MNQVLPAQSPSQSTQLSYFPSQFIIKTTEFLHSAVLSVLRYFQYLAVRYLCLFHALYKPYFKYKKIVADAGYESEENYLFLEENGQIFFIKPSNYKISKTRKYKNDISCVENVEYIEKEDYYMCKLRQRLEVSKIKHSKSKT